MEMMMMDLDKLPDPFSIPFQDLSDLNFPAENSAVNYRPPPPSQHHLVNYNYPTLEPVGIPAPPFKVSHDQFPRASWLQEKPDTVEAMREMIFRMAALQPVQIDPESVKPPKRRNVKISKDPQSVAARHRRERISERIRILQRLVPGGTKMDTASMLDEAVHYMKFLKKQVESLEQAAAAGGGGGGSINHHGHGVRVCPSTTTMNHHHGANNYPTVIRACGEAGGAHMVGSMELLK